MNNGDHGPMRKRSRLDMARFTRAADAVPTIAFRAAKQLQCTENTVYKLAHLGAVETDVQVDGDKLQVRFVLTPSDTRLTLYRAWVARVLRWNYRTAVRHKEVRATCAIEPSEPQPAGLDRFCCDQLLRIGSTHRAEVQAFYVDHGKAATERDRLAALIAEDGWRAMRPGQVVPVQPELVPLRFPILKGLPETALDASAGDAEAPHPAVLGRAMALERFAECAVMFCFVAAASDFDGKSQRKYVRAFEAVERRIAEGREGKLRSIDADETASGKQIQRAIGSMLAEAAEGRPGCTALYEAAALYRSALRHLRRYVSQLDESDRAGLAAILPPPLSSEKGLREALQRASTVVQDRGNARRKAVSNRIAARLDADAASVRFSMEQITAIREDAAVAAAELVLHSDARDRLPEHERERTPGHVEFLVPTTVLDRKGDIVRGASQTLVFRAWRERDAWLSLEPGALRKQRRGVWKGPITSPDGTPGIADRGRRTRPAPTDAARQVAKRALVDAALTAKLKDVRAAPEKYGDVVFEFRGCLPGEGGVTCEPRFITLLRHYVDHGSALLDARQQRRRHRLMQNWNLRACRTSPEGILTLDQSKIGLGRWMNSRGRVLVPVEATYFAMLFGTLAFDIVTETLARLSEAIQPEQDLARWTVDDTTGEEVIAFLAAIKAERGAPPRPAVPLFISEPLFNDVMDAGREVAHALGREDGWLPRVDEPAGRPREADPEQPALKAGRRRRPLIFQWKNGPLAAGPVGDLIGWVLPNRGQVTAHPLRHAGANRLRAMGVPEPVIQAILHHKSERMTAWYSRPDPQQVRRGSAVRSRLVRAEAARAHAVGAGAI